MACSCQGGSSGQWQIVNADSTVQPGTYATAAEAQAELMRTRSAGFVRKVAK